MVRLSNEKIVVIVIHLLIWVVLILLFFNSVDLTNKLDAENRFRINSIGTFAHVIFFYTLFSWLVPHFFWGERKTFLVKLCWVFCLFCLVEVILDYIFFTDYVTNYIYTYLTTEVMINGLIVIGSIGSRFAYDWTVNKRRFENIIKQKEQSELELLKGQLNPHLLFNSLNLLYSKSVSAGNTELSDIIERLSGLLRYNLYTSSQQRVPLSTELNYIKDYLFLYEERYRETLKVEFKTQGNPDNFEVEPLLLLPLVENALKHGQSNDGSISYVSAATSIDDTMFYFEIRNSYPATSNKTDSGGIGLQNLRKRLDLIYGESYDLEILKHDLFTVKLKIDLK